MGLAISRRHRNDRLQDQSAPTRPQRNWKSSRVVNLLDIVGRTPYKHQLNTLIKRRPIAGRILNEINGEFEYLELKDAKVVDVNCLAYISHRNREGKHVRETLHAWATKSGFKHNCSNSVIKAGDGSVYLLECVVVFL
ncbi:hypothetical protein PRIPAC_97970 [Pristionchus pacificus]|uniref:Uncharacterized protein n=1 Tax=Pristionchus pacificus TaxID=54126 RepID=A0A454XR51_PRIPA|nr:hypothetical protein PRIPAC_97970 [Pristionchus pacificus]|eukprot:PDM60426.1 hypothetical protein PRIPAC_54251 [Pristionchus pacificus]